MDIRYICWAGNDFLGPGVSVQVGPPNMEAQAGLEDGSGGVGYREQIKAKEIAPSMRGRMAVQSSPRIVHDELRPFPGPSNT